MELGVIIGKMARRINAQHAMKHVGGTRFRNTELIPIGYVLALDLTARTIQQDAIKKGLPWTVSKGYDTFTPIRFVFRSNIP